MLILGVTVKISGNFCISIVIGLYTISTTIVSLVRVAVYSWMYMPYVASEHKHVKAENSQASQP